MERVSGPRIPADDTKLTADLIGVVTLADKNAAGKMEQVYADHEKVNGQVELKEEQEKAEAQETEVAQAEARGDALIWPRLCWRLAW